MSPFSFVIRTAILTSLLVLALQIRWGNETLEDITMNALTSSAVVTPLNKTAEGAVRFARNMITKANRSFDTHFSRALLDENRPGSRHLGIGIERSEKAVKNKVEEVEDAAKGAYQEARESEMYKKMKASADRAKAKIKSQFIDEESSGKSSAER